MKRKYLCKTIISGKFEKGEVYVLEEEDRQTRMYVRLGYLEYVPRSYSKKNKTKVIDND